jgi:hypothetical protein
MRDLLEEAGVGSSVAVLPDRLKTIVEAGWTRMPSGAIVLSAFEGTARLTLQQLVSSSLSGYEAAVNGLRLNYVVEHQGRWTRADRLTLLPIALEYARQALAAATVSVQVPCNALVMSGRFTIVRFWAVRPESAIMDSQEALDGTRDAAALIESSELGAMN